MIFILFTICSATTIYYIRNHVTIDNYDNNKILGVRKADNMVL